MTVSPKLSPVRYPQSAFSTPRRSGRIDWVVPLAAVIGLGIAGFAAMRAGGSETQAAPLLNRASIVPISAPAEPGAPQVYEALATETRAINRCDAISGDCRMLPVEDTLYRMNDGSEWLARTAFDDAGQIEYTLWYDHTGAMVGAPLGLQPGA
ncbi:hypothetical protein JI664_14435 [Rhodobacter sp. NTK016B]|uniref:hypothetical protein n=1 Tax=Rhodobacter sp. NTK016B TaxID=2759676 RepID=UPI001A8ED436|nr:hypothetical protein [Rhodobacter sp. NTK016B]MBN8293169.1 hypothetical protein [Rhodobacter sp. NTK016B]